MSDQKSLPNKIMQMIMKNQMRDAISSLQDVLKNSPAFETLVIQSARYNDVMRSIHNGTVDFENANIEKNQIRYALIDMVRELEMGLDQNEDLMKEIKFFLQKNGGSINKRMTVKGTQNIVIQDGSGNNVQINGASQPDKES